MRTHCGGFEEVGMTAVDCKNFKRDLNLYIGKHDAEMVVQRLTLKKKYNPDFSCDYFTTDEGNLGGLFWADEVMKHNFIMFGDVVAFDATYRSNKYDMVFVPFTGIDNHHRNVTLGAALLGSETAEAYTWLLKAFKKAFGAVPRVVVTDQDLAMKKAIRDVFTTSRHRLCMWHIMKKLAEKVGVTIRRDKTFKRRLCDIVWTDSIEPIYFESKWMEIIRDFNLTGNKWLTDMYAIRNDWIPAYYHHEHMSGLMRTTSHSESENHFFGQVANSSLTLVEFLSHFDTAIESQRYTHRKNDHFTRYTTPDWVTDYDLEKEAEQIYTRNIFKDVQEEIYNGINKCTSRSSSEVDDFIKFEIKELVVERSGLYEVMFREEDMDVLCSCHRYEQYGLLCRHIFCVFWLCQVQVFPKNYVKKRWTREVVTSKPSEGISNKNIVNKDVDAVQSVVREIMSANDHIVNRLVNNMDHLSLYRDYVKEQMVKADEISGVSQPVSKKDRVATLLGFNQPSEDTVLVPVGIRTKGCGSKKRFKPISEQIANKPARKTRSCGICGSIEHDKRTCTTLGKGKQKV
ncbi:protein FAR1-RELATED SEQUENCE 5-like [Helianthus annuus]|uniref:protein FAR1-RELATED SEQUENCE 5-like n=1 Tax=Helianthus annuus TaxID=4232 RepID=UPI000B904AF8|nr:protein FAR1-RELATED SEQUENCE 5-like [Helianthus annuus]